ncbi:MAG TPA: hypothetical protein VFH73_00800 [Polyangia bacterium]|nr:hypothetical protein [Polyangia bacterium]
MRLTPQRHHALTASLAIALTATGLGACGNVSNVGADGGAASAGTGGGAGGAVSSGSGGSATGSGGAMGGKGGSAGGTGGALAGATVYYRDVQPIVERACQSCHVDGGIAPFVLASYEDARTHALPMAAATKARQMPPWLPEAGCGDFRDSRALTDAEIATINNWAATGAPAGDPRDARTGTPPTPPQLGTPGASLDPGASYPAKAGLTDDYHCFLFDPALAAQRDLIGFNIHPGAKTSVHHVLLFAIPPASVAVAKAKDDAEAGAGWTCFGGAGVMGAQTIAGWVPGSGPGVFPPPTGIRLAAGTQIVMQMHYNLLSLREKSDRTTADLFYSTTPVSKPAVITGVANQSFVVPAGTREMTVTGVLDVKTQAALWGVVPHMHLHGRRIKVEIIHPDGSTDCSVNIPGWDFHWQQFYYYKQPLRAMPGDKVQLSCTYDNSPESYPVTAGARPPPADLRWGEKTTDEMCLNYLYVSAP